MVDQVKEKSSNKTLAILEPAKTLGQFRDERKAFRELVKLNLKEDKDFGLIPGTKKKSLWQPGAEKLASYFGLVSNFKLIKEIEEFGSEGRIPFVYYKYMCTLTHFETRKVVGQAERSCNSGESAKRKAMDAGRSIFDLINTCQAMAQKRAFVAAIRTVTMASDFFADDVSNGEPGPTTAAKDPIRTNQIAKLHAVARQRGFDEVKIHKAIFVVYKARSITDLTGVQIAQLTEDLTQDFKIVGIGNEPERYQPKVESKKSTSSVQEGGVVGEKEEPKGPKKYTSSVQEGEVVAEEEAPKKPKMCAQCKEKPAKASGFCSPECQDKYYPPEKTLKEKMEMKNESKKIENEDLREMTLKSGIKVWFDPKSKEKCECGAEIYWAVTDKNKKSIPIELVGLSDWDVHWASCPLADIKKKKKGK